MNEIVNLRLDIQNAVPISFGALWGVGHIPAYLHCNCPKAAMGSDGSQKVAPAQTHANTERIAAATEDIGKVVFIA